MGSGAEIWEISQHHKDVQTINFNCSFSTILIMVTAYFQQETLKDERRGCRENAFLRFSTTLDFNSLVIYFLK